MTIQAETGVEGFLERALLYAGQVGPGVALPKERQGSGILDTLAAAFEQISVRAERFRSPIFAAVSSLRSGDPLITVDSEGSLLLLSQRRGRYIRVEDVEARVEWMDTVQLQARLGAQSTTEEWAWLGLKPFNEATLPSSAKVKPIFNALRLVRSEGKNLTTIIIYAVGVGLLSLTLPLAVQSLVNTVAFGQLIQPLLVLTLMLAAGLIFAAVLRALQAWVVEVLQRRLFVKLVSELANRLPRVHVEAFEAGQGPELVNRFFDVFTAQKAVASILLGGVEALLTALVGLLVLAFYHPALLGFGLLLVLGASSVFSVLGKGAVRGAIYESKAKFAVAGWLEEMARHVFALKMQGGARYSTSQLDQLAAQWLHYRSEHFTAYFRQYVGALVIQVIAHASLLGLGGFLVLERQLTIGQLVAAELIVTAVVGSISKLGSKLESAYDLIAAADKLGVLLGLPLEADDGEEALCGTHPASIEMRDVSSSDGKIENLSLYIEPGSTTALYCDRKKASGLVELLFGLRQPKSGSILLDGQDLRDIRLTSLRSRVGVVREPEVLQGTIADNLQTGATRVAASELWGILKDVGLEQKVRALPSGLKTKILPSGAPLDRLEALRLTIARILVARPSVLVLDSAMEAFPEEERLPLISRLSRHRTLLVLTHEHSVAALCEFGTTDTTGRGTP